MQVEAEFLTRVVRDTLDSIVSSSAREALIAESLELAGEWEIPTDGARFAEFLQGPLRRTLERALGQELGASVVLELERIASERVERVELPALSPNARKRHSKPRNPRTRAAQVDPREVPTVPPRSRRQGSGQNPKAEASIPSAPPVDLSAEATAATLPARARSSAPTPPISADFPKGTASAFGMVSSKPPQAGAVSTGVKQRQKLPLVLIATRDTDLVRRFGSWLDPRAAVVRVSRLMDLLVDLQDAVDRRAVVVLDAQSPAFRVAALAALHDELPRKVQVVLWGPSTELTSSLRQLFPGVSEWLLCSERTPLAEVVERCAELVA